MSRRSPPRSRRWRTTCPEPAGTGATPARRAKAASERRRPGCDQATSSCAALIVPTPGSSGSQGASDPTRAAARDFPEAAAANRSIFYDKAGRARSAQEVYGLLAASHANTQVAASTGAMLAQARPTSATATAYASDAPPVPIAAALAPGRAKGLIGLFSTEGPRTPVSKAVANLWTTPRGGASRGSEEDPATRYFPRQGTAATTEAGSTAAGSKPAKTDGETQSAPVSVRAPLPPSRPRELGTIEAKTAVAEDGAGSTAARRPRRGPLDLSQFMTHGRRG